MTSAHRSLWMLATSGGPDVRILVWNLSSLSHRGRVGVLAGGIVFCYVVYFLLQEMLFKSAEFPYGGFVMFVENSIFSAFALFEQTLKGLPSQRKAPLRWHALLGLVSIAASSVSLYSLNILNFPTWVLFKSCRLIFVMIGGIFMLSKRYALLDYVAVGCMTFGLILFTLGDYALNLRLNPIGLVMVTSSLLLNSFQGNFQEGGMKRMQIPQLEMIIYSSFFAACWILPWLIVSGELEASVKMIFHQPNAGVIIFSAAPLSYIGYCSVIGLMQCTSALTTQIITSCRKALTIILSFLLFAKPFTSGYFFGGVLVFCGVGLHVYASEKKKHPPAKMHMIETQNEEQV